MTEPLENLTDLPDEGSRGIASGDLLSHVLAQIRLTGDRVMSNALAQGEVLNLDRDAAYAVVMADGELHVDAGDEGAGRIDKGDLVLLPRGPGDLRLWASSAQADVVVCRFWFDPYSLRGMISALPQRIHIRRAQAVGWLDGMLPFLMIEVTDAQPGSALMISRIIDLIVIRTLRTWVHLGNTSGWLGGLSDARVGRALKAIHEEPTRHWSIDALAGVAGMSRSSFCERFNALVGRPPLRYHNEWRLNLARDMLVRRDARVGEIGLRVGYVSEAAFSRAYKALFGHSPREAAEHGGSDHRPGLVDME
ncbi:AraC family transcriptional regulator [Lichenifustis flavocetrariae]|uniref:AraC family transcriptional regulator n=1 Tax=Lichenifustis flavocetrariae TaxID=2949735 RepID=A0AA42CMV3_9HYPH|nr:AraC family transcriptional regulator [Lichenifustis flavocetrariae]MCW6512903.1 AraC family transcriptional regulator [Lichenifustis flavocetrariae]